MVIVYSTDVQIGNCMTFTVKISLELEREPVLIIQVNICGKFKIFIGITFYKQQLAASLDNIRIYIRSISTSE